MAEVTSGSNVEIVMVLNKEESIALAKMMFDWVDDSFTRGTDCGDPEVIADYKCTADTLKDVFDSFGVRVEE